jgi:hypothetical protein
MKKEQPSQQHIDAILQSLDGMQRAEPQPFFYTRLQAKLENRPAERSTWGWIGKPVFSFATLLLLLVLNITAINSYLKTKTAVTQTSTDIERFAKEYNLDGSSAYTDKPEP